MAKTKTKTKKKPANRVNGDKVPRAQHSVPRHTTAFLNMVDKAQKAQSDKMIFFRIEDEYDLFFEDAEKAEHILGLRVKGELGVTYTSFPAREYETNLGLLLRAGQRVAVCETGGEPVEVVDPVESPVPETAASDIAKRINRNPKSVASFLSRFAEKNPDCRVETDSKRNNEPGYLYRTSDVWPALENWLKGDTSD